jgi:nucleoside-diphosphate-sugar epimerase
VTIERFVYILSVRAQVGASVAALKPVTIGEILTMLRRMQGRSLAIIYVPLVSVCLLLMVCNRKDLWTRLSGNLIVDTSKLESTGWRPAIDTYAGLLAMMRSVEAPDHKLDG